MRASPAHARLACHKHGAAAYNIARTRTLRLRRGRDLTRERSLNVLHAAIGLVEDA
jgi:hypothetical protein